MLCSVWSQSVKVSYQTGRTKDYSLVSLHVRKWLVSWRTPPPVPNILIRTGLYLIGMWYKCSEAQKRFGLFLSFATLRVWSTVWLQLSAFHRPGVSRGCK